MCTTHKDWQRHIQERCETDAEGWISCTGLDKNQAETLLDWLEVQGCAPREVLYNEEKGFTVRWRNDK